MRKNAVTPAPKQRAVEFHYPAEGMFRTYANNVAIAATGFDLKLLFGELVEITMDKAIVEHRVQVTITWLEAKILADFLRVNIKAYEEANGPLNMPKVMKEIVVPETFSSAERR